MKIIKIKTIKDINELINNNEDYIFDISDNTTLVQDNIDYFKKLYKNNKKLLFKIGRIITLEEIINCEIFLEHIVNEIKSYNFTDFEKLIAVYDIVKNFKRYTKLDLDNKEEVKKGSEIYEILTNEYILCYGYTNLMNNLLNRLNIKTSKVINRVYRHSISLVYINDNVYNIHGEYLSDPLYEDKNIFKYKYLALPKSVYEKVNIVRSIDIKDKVKKSKPIPPNTILNALIRVKKRIFNGETLLEHIKKVIEENKWNETDKKCKYKYDTINKRLIEINTIKIYADNIDEIKRSVLTSSLQNKKLVIYLSPDTRLIQENIDYFRYLYKTNANVEIYIGKTLTLKQIIKAEDFLANIAKEINSKDFTPLEKMIAVYDIVKNFKKGKEIKTDNMNNKFEPCGVYPIIYSDYIICRGFTNLLVDLLTRVNIKSENLACYTKRSSIHYLAKVYMEDKENNIYGEYISDPTIENNKLNKYHELLATKEDFLKHHMAIKDVDINNNIKIKPKILLDSILKVKKTIFTNFDDIKEEYIIDIILTNKWYEVDDECKELLDTLIDKYYDKYINMKIKDIDSKIGNYILSLNTPNTSYEIDKNNKVYLTFKYNESIINEQLIKTISNYEYIKVNDTYTIEYYLDNNLTIKDLLTIAKQKDEEINNLLCIPKNLNI